MKFLLTLVLLFGGLSFTLNACQSAKDKNQEAVVEFIHSAFPTNPQVWVQSLPPNVAENYRTAMQQELAGQLADCGKCSFAIARLELKRQDSGWQVNMFGKINRSSTARSIPFNKTLIVEEISPAKEPHFVIQSIGNLED